MKKSLVYLVFFAALAIGSRLIAPWPNFTAMIAVTFAGGLLFKNKAAALLFPLVIVFFSDLIINNTLYSTGSMTWLTSGAIYIYGAYALVAILGFFNSASSSKMKSLALGGLVSSILFYLITNLGVWAGGILYPMNPSGLMSAYLAGIPFLMNQVLGTLVYGAIIYSFYSVYESASEQAELAK